MYTLTADQKQELVEILIEEFGDGLEFEDFTDATGHTLLDSREEAGVFVIVLEKRKG